MAHLLNYLKAVGFFGKGNRKPIDLMLIYMGLGRPGFPVF